MHRVSFRKNAAIDALLYMWKEEPQSRLKRDGKPVSIAQQIDSSVRYLLRLWLEQSIGDEDIHRISSGGISTGFYRVDLTQDTHILVSSLTADTAVKKSQIVRAAILLSPEMQTRKQLEEEYLKRSGLGDPSFMSADFLHLWCKYRNEGPTTDGVRIVRAIRDLEIRFHSILQKVDRQEKVLDTYGIKGILNSLEAPTKAQILSLEGKPLRALCKRWKVPLATQVSDGVIRRLLLSKFGYQQEL